MPPRQVSMPPLSGSEQNHVDLGALAQRVTSTETAITSLSQEVSKQFSAMSSSFSSQIRDIAQKIDSQQTAYASSRSTNWPAIIASGVGILTVAGGFFFSQMRPYDNDLARHDREITRLQSEALAKDDFKEYTGRNDLWVGSIRDRLRSDEDSSVNQRQVADIKDALAHLTSRIEAVDGSLVKRPEIEELLGNLNERTSTLSARMNEISRQLGDLAGAPRPK